MIEAKPKAFESHGIPDATTLGILIRSVRVAAGLTQRDAAELCGVSAPFLNGVERGKPTAQIGHVLRVCAALGIRLEARGPAPLPADLSTAPRRKPRRRKQR
jgi:HTH-type transcriptional regulator/antitoxin HipB